MNPRAPLWTLAMIFLIIKWIIPDSRPEAVFALMYQVVLLCILVSWLWERFTMSTTKQTKKVWHD